MSTFSAASAISLPSIVQMTRFAKTKIARPMQELKAFLTFAKCVRYNFNQRNNRKETFTMESVATATNVEKQCTPPPVETRASTNKMQMKETQDTIIGNLRTADAATKNFHRTLPSAPSATSVFDHFSL